MKPPAAFPWNDVMAFGLGRLAWPPGQFWAATPREIAAALKAHRSAEAGVTDRAVLSALMAAYPDS
ncbi:phage tail assembly chaperone [Bosea sp. F3-2]|uniref:phage tail assembly chaperone n=1 Tax=Bosea sp. F3-2 TaxID=2599640 RepID=UPI0011F00A5D|nr:phage tail assembly chaperone [Bosea sp. F3-2]QEL23033.1 phage tail assembly chaperone [Bosea sp. F3-2]